MVFSSITFLFLFLPVTIVLYYCFRGMYRNVVLLLLSLFFYAWGEGGYVLLMLFSIGFNYIIGLALFKADKAQSRKIYLVLGIVVNLLLLSHFKYANWFFSSIGSPFSHPVHLPIGISFFTFQAISYIIDVYRNETTPQKNPLHVGLYIASFPQLIAGPIVRYHEVARQIISRTHSCAQFVAGIERFIFGLSKKVLIANSMAKIADLIFMQDYTVLPWEIAWLGIACYSLQIYFDFSGYSDMAVGLGLMFGFKFPENFNYPYIACSVQEFWRRWHMSLSNWFKDYLYIPLGGNRDGNIKKYRNLFIVFLLCGLWHGASWNFIVWGLIHGSFIVLEYIVIKKLLAIFPRIFAHIYTLLVVVNSWVFFRVEGLSRTIDYLKAMYGFIPSPDQTITAGILLEADVVFIFFFVTAVFLSLPFYSLIGSLKINFLKKKNFSSFWENVFLSLKYVYVFFLMYVSFSFLAIHSYNPFIYFRF